MIKKSILAIVAVILIGVFCILYFFWWDSVSDKYDVSIDQNDIPIFEEINLPFEHKYNKEKSLPIAPSAFIDLDNDGVDELFLGGGMDQEDAIFAFRDNEFVNISAEVNLPTKGTTTTSISSVAADFDNNGFSDLMIAREDGLYIYFNTDGKFTSQKIDTPVNEKSTPAGITVGDIDRDGDLDIFLATYIKKELMEGQTIFERKDYGSTSELLLNDGNNSFTSITKEAGLEYIHNTFQGVFVDIDGDSWLDLVVVHDTGEPRIYQNNGDLTFTMKPNPMTDKFSYPMGLAVGDYNNDGRVDFMFSNTGSTLPRSLAKGDIKDESKFDEKWILFRNEGDFIFTNTAEETKIANYEFSWGCTFADMNNDGLQDLMVAENYVDLAPNQLFRLKSRMLIQKPDETFVPTEKESRVINPCFGITGLVSDLNLDGYLDFVWVNINTPSNAYLNRGGNRNYLKVKLPKNAANIGSQVSVHLPSGRMLTDYLVTGEGLASDQTGILHFGLGNEEMIERVKIFYPNGKSYQVENPEINTVLEIDDTLDE
ncbi:MAG: hypothetical protein Tsb0034_05100 [Ekhidna sp.]